MSQPFLFLDLPDADATAHLAQQMAPALQAGDVLLLEGPIGAGKTHFARSLIQHRLAMLGRHEDVPSPTFTLVQVYLIGIQKLTPMILILILQKVMTSTRRHNQEQSCLA